MSKQYTITIEYIAENEEECLNDLKEAFSKSSTFRKLKQYVHGLYLEWWDEENEPVKILNFKEYEDVDLEKN